METFTIRDLRERTGELVRGAEQGHLSVVTKHGQLVFVAVPVDELLVREGVSVALAIKLFQDGTLSLGKAARLSRMNLPQFSAKLAEQGIPAVDYPPEELDAELAANGLGHRSRRRSPHRVCAGRSARRTTSGFR